MHSNSDDSKLTEHDFAMVLEVNGNDICLLSGHTSMLQDREWNCTLKCKEESKYSESEMERTKQGTRSLKPPETQVIISNSSSKN